MKKGTILFDDILTTIGEDAFKDCENLTSITLPKKVNSILANAFQNCINLNEINYNGNSSDFKKIKFEANWNDNVPAEYAYCNDDKVRIKFNYLTFTAQQDNSSIGLTKLSTNQTLEYSTDTITWNTFDTTTNISLNNRDKVYVRGVLSVNNTEFNYTQFKMTGKIVASGNCNALWNYQDLNAPLKKYCGYNMFRNCTSLTTAPKLPATILAKNCYSSMFYGCKSLTAAPELPATTLADYCFANMFNGCRALTTAPSMLPATTLAEACYYGMFNGCSSLTAAPELPATTLAELCCWYMFYNCKSLTTAPELPATTLNSSCYREMFYGCSKLNHIKCMATNISASNCTSDWVNGVSSTGTFIKHPDMNNWTTGVNGIPSGWTVEDAVL